MASVFEKRTWFITSAASTTCCFLNARLDKARKINW
jgi:hypothetical protein